MDDVYSCADVTIIAAAGEDENTGLPGVGELLRRKQLTVDLGDIKILSSMPHPEHTIRASRWWTRGWTYQEAVLSRRRLVFTEDQVYFECNAIKCYESIHIDQDRLWKQYQTVPADFMSPGIFQGLRHISLTTSYLYKEHVEQYSKKTLTYEEDPLNAFTGIMRRLSTNKNPVFQIWGIPILRNRAAQSEAPSRQDIYNGLIEGLLWAHLHQDRHPARRRPGLPSWSWAGWVGKVNFHSSLSSLTRCVGGIRLEYEHGDLHELSDSFSRLREESFSKPFALHLDVDVISLGKRNIFESPDFGGTWGIRGIRGYRTAVHISGGVSDKGSISDLFATRKWQLVLLHISRWSQENSHLRFIIVDNQFQSASRVGVFYLHDVDWEQLKTEVQVERRTVRLI